MVGVLKLKRGSHKNFSRKNTELIGIFSSKQKFPEGNFWCSIMQLELHLLRMDLLDLKTFQKKRHLPVEVR